MKRLLIASMWKVAPLLVFGGSLANANTVQYSADIFSPAGSQMPINAVTLTLPKFDISQGVLSSVDLFVYWADTSSITVANNDNLNAHAFSGAIASIPLTLSGVGFSDLNFLASTNPIASATSTPNFTNAGSGPVPGMPVPPAITFVGLPCPPGQACTFNGVNVYNNIQNTGQNSTSVTVNNWGLFSTAGTGTFNVTLLGGIPVFSGTEIGGLGHIMFTGDVLIGGKVVVLYTFTPGGAAQVPEPVTLLLIGPALAGLVFKLRRKPRLSV